jgi:hypothetical protein
MLGQERCDYLVHLVDQLSPIHGWFTGRLRLPISVRVSEHGG